MTTTRSCCDHSVQELARCSRVALVGPDEAFSANLPLAAVNPERLVNQLVFARATKTPFEVARMREATAIGVRGHVAARDAFRAGGSEFDIHMAYLAASGQEESKLPYPNIIALNEHAGILHYQHYDRRPPARQHSFLIDAGGRSAGYHADITRTYSATPGDDFDALIDALDEKQPGARRRNPRRPFLRRPAYAHAPRDRGSPGAFRPGPSAAPRAPSTARSPTRSSPTASATCWGCRPTTLAASSPTPTATRRSLRSASRRCATRGRSTWGHVFTVEPGLYFIPMLLDALRESEAGADVNWAKVDALRPCGGIRIEDNVVVTGDGADNLTRPAFAQIDRPEGI